MLKRWGVADEDVVKVKKVSTIADWSACISECQEQAHRRCDMTVTVASPEAEERVMKLLNGLDSGKGKKLAVKRKGAVKRTLGEGDRSDEGEDEEGGEDMGAGGEGEGGKARQQGGRKKSKMDEEEGGAAVVHDVRDVVTPLWKTPYAEQVAGKNKEMGSILNKMRRKTEREGKQKTAAWPVDIVKPIAVLPDGGEAGVERNKLSFTIGYDNQGAPCIGFRVGRTEHGSTAVADPSLVCFCAPGALAVRNALQQVLLEPGSPPAKNNVSHKGFWRQLEVRTNLRGESLAVVTVDEQSVDAVTLVVVKERVRTHLLASVPGLVGLGWQHNASLSNGGTTDVGEIEYMKGDGFLTEQVGELVFRIPPAAFFQTNSVRVVHLYDMVTEAVRREAERLKEEAGGQPIRVFDVCCGIGTIGLYLRKQLGSAAIGDVVGIDIEPSAIGAAQQNAELNKLESGMSFVASPAEKVLPGKLKGQEGVIIAVVDPPRAGLHSDVTRALRNCRAVKSVVYVSCNPKSLVSDCVPLCKPPTKRFEHQPFVPTYLSGCDMFPHTELMESVAIFERQKD